MGEQLRLNILESYLSHYRIAHEEKQRKETEQFWRGRIALEIIESCNARIKKGEACEVCQEEAEYIILRGNKKRTF